MTEETINEPVNEFIRAAVQRYVEHHIPFGSFMSAVIIGDLAEAERRADSHNKKHLAEIVAYVEEHVPSEARGSAQNYADWVPSLNPAFPS